MPAHSLREGARRPRSPVVRHRRRQETVWCYNSWGPAWGGRKNGTFYFFVEYTRALLGEQGDATFRVPRERPNWPILGRESQC